jgi:hypothetical protein
MLIFIPPQTPSFEPVFRRSTERKPPLEDRSAYDGPRLSFDLKSMP